MDRLNAHFASIIHFAEYDTAIFFLFLPPFPPLCPPPPPPRLMQDAYIWRRHKRVAREYEADLQDAQLEDEDDLFEYDNVFEEMEHSQPGVLRPEAKFALMRLDSGASDDYFGGDDRVPLIPHVPVSASDPYSGFWDNRLSTITEESAAGVGGFNPERDNIHLYSINRTPRVYGDKGTSSLQQSLFDTEHVGTLV